VCKLLVEARRRAASTAAAAEAEAPPPPAGRSRIRGGFKVSYRFKSFCLLFYYLRNKYFLSLLSDDPDQLM